MITKQDFTQAIADTVDRYPSVAALYQAGDPRILQPLDAMATMLAMLSAQLEVAQAEVFEKVRDSTVLADMALKGVLRKAIPARVVVSVANKNTTAITIDSGRVLLDSDGRSYVVDTSATVQPGTVGTVNATQVKRTVINHTVLGSAPFYAIEIPNADDDSYLSGLSVSDTLGLYEFRDRYVNTMPGERIFHVEVDDMQVMYVKFGKNNVVGVQPVDGSVITVTVSRTAGELVLDVNSPFAFEYILAPQESAIELTFNGLLVPGNDPMSMSQMRDLSKYPSIYDSNAVYLGEFDFLVRRNFTELKFLSVWNEAAEELARGASVDNINTLFVACSYSSEPVLIEPSPGAIIPNTSLTQLQQAIKAVINKADSSYRVKFYTPVKSKIYITINARVATSYVTTDVKTQIEEVLINAFGDTAEASKRGNSRALYQKIYALLKEKVPAFTVGNADLNVNVVDQPALNNRPEMWRYVAKDSLTINVENVNITTPAWGF